MNRYTLAILIALLVAGSPAAAQNYTTTTFKVSGACGMCEDRIEKTYKKKGIQSADWDINTQQVTISYDPAKFTAEKLQKMAADAGHDAELYKATEADYKALPDCCLYRDIAVHGDEVEEEEHDSEETLLHGVIVTEDKKGTFTPLEGASVTWLNGTTGTATDKNGVFKLPVQKNASEIVISYAGFAPDTLDVKDKNHLSIVLNPNDALAEVKVMARLRSSYINSANPFRINTMTSRELLKAACCNLSESFETNPSVDVSYNDAVTGAKQIQLLGLAGNYVQLTVENMPGPRGIATPVGLNTISGTWVESIQLMKGTGSVVNGFESIAGQINVELKKPETAERLYINGYVNSQGKTDLNLNYAQKLGARWSTMVLLHDAFLENKMDGNDDGFRDQPTGNLFTVMNRWYYNDNKGLMFQFGGKYLTDKKTAGVLMHEPSHKIRADHYGGGINAERWEGFGKIGYIFPAKKYRSISLQLSASQHDQDAYFGLAEYNASQRSLYANLIYQDILGNSKHKYRAGFSYSNDRFRELFHHAPFDRDEIVPGAFFEYTWSPADKFNLVAGLRGDDHNLYGGFITPRLNIRYEPLKGTIVRLNAGRGQRTANIFAENLGYFISSRQLTIGAGLKPEVAWNNGISVDQKLRLFNREAMLSVDFFRNDFENQVVVDVEDPRFISFYNLDGRSYSNSFQAEISFIPVKALDVRLAYRWFDVKSTFNGELKQRPFTAAHRGFMNLAYEVKNWKFDYTMNYIGDKRLPSTKENPVQYRLAERSPSYVTMNAQATRSFGKKKNFELYLGVENLGNYFQEKAIIAPEDAFGEYFDASMIWGPLTERMFYGGFRFKLK